MPKALVGCQAGQSSRPGSKMVVGWPGFNYFEGHRTVKSSPKFKFVKITFCKTLGQREMFPWFCF